MGNDEEKHRHEAEIKKINNEAKLKEYIEKNNLIKYTAEIERERSRDQYYHEEIMEQKRNEREDNNNKYLNEKLRIEQDSENRKQEMNYAHEERVKELGEDEFIAMTDSVVTYTRDEKNYY